MHKDAGSARDPNSNLFFANVGNRPDLGDSREVAL